MPKTYDLISTVMHLFALLSETVREHPDSEAFISEDSRCTFKQLHSTSLTAAIHLHARGIRHGMRVALVCRNGIPFVSCVFALLRLGAVCVPLNWRLAPEEIGAQLEHADAALLLHDTESVSQLPPFPESCVLPVSHCATSLHTAAQLPPEPRGIDPACIIYTAGTSDSPRGVVLSHGNLLANSRNYCTSCGFAPGQRELATTQLFHISTFSRLFTYVRSAAACYLMKRFDPAECFDIITRERISSITQTPSMYHMLLQAPAEGRRAGAALSRVITGASAMSPIERQGLRDVFPNAGLYDIYGQTEAGPGISVLGPQDFFRKPRSVGKPMPGVRVTIVDEAGRELPPGSIGEITCRGDTIMLGYFRNESATNEVLVRGRLHTGDMGYCDEEGFLYIAGRKKDIIITGGINVYPPEIENVLRLHPGVVDCAVFGVPDKQWGEAVVAAVVLRNATVDDIHALCRKHLAGFKCPKEILPVPEIPRNTAQKTVRKELISWWQNRTQYKKDTN
jgi:acyl-CoA synthetase (AMP-forming)/AMP-acid ligase II